MHKKIQLLAYLNGMADVENIYPILARIHVRNRLDVRAIVYSKLLKKEIRLKETFERNGLTPEIGSKLSMKFLFRSDIRKSDAILTKEDPYWDTTTRHRRAKYLIKLGKPSIFLQHGAYQLGVNSRLIKGKMDYYSPKLLFWENPDFNQDLFNKEVLQKIETVGFTKTNILPKREWNAEIKKWLQKYKCRLLICQSFRWGNNRFQEEDIKKFYGLIESIIKEKPNLGIIIRSHRGKTRRIHRHFDNALEKKFDNILFSHHYKGPLAKATINDVIDLCDAMICPTSTTVLDCVYSGKPVAIFNEGLSLFPEVPEISNVEHLKDFLENIGKKDMGQKKLLQRFGDINENLDRASEAIENFLLK